MKTKAMGVLTIALAPLLLMLQTVHRTATTIKTMKPMSNGVDSLKDGLFAFSVLRLFLEVED